MKKSLLSLCILSALVAGCSSSTEATDPDDLFSDNPLLADELLTNIDASNYAPVLTASLDMLRTDVYDRTTGLLDSLSSAWESNEEAVIGTQQHDCNGGGTVDRVVTDAPVVAPEAMIPEFKLASRLTFTDCSIDDQVLNGSVDWNWNRSSPAQLGSTTYTNIYAFDELSLTNADTAETLTGAYDVRITLAGPGDSYDRTSTTQRYIKTQGENSSTLTDASYTQQFSHFIAQQSSTNGIFHEFKESGNGTLSIESLGISNAAISMDPALVYANTETVDSSIHSDALASGALDLTIESGSSLAVSIASVENMTLTYTITDAAGQETNIEREWISPATCRPDPRFNYDSCG